MNPILSREVRVRWRDGRAFWLVFVVAAGLSLLFASIYGTESSSVETPGLSPNNQWAQVGHNLFSQLAWIQALAWLLIAPTLTSASIAYERERGWFDALLLSPLSPSQISLSKWATALFYAAILYFVTLPFSALTLLLGGVSPGEYWLVVALHLLCASGGAAIGLAASAWSYRSNVALRTAYGLILIWLLGSLGGAVAVGGLPFRIGGLSFSNTSWFWEWFGHTNPVLCALEITSSDPIQSWPTCFSFLAGLTGFFLWAATRYCRRPLLEAPFIEAKKRGRRRGKKGGAPLPSHGEIPLVTRLKFHNPVLDREVRAKFRMRQPPLGVILVEALLAVLVAYFYVRTLIWACTEPHLRPTIWWGLIFTAMIVTMMSSAVMGGNGISRERESGTWDGVRLSLLRHEEILRGKLYASVITCALFSLPVWPLLLPCISWRPGYDGLWDHDLISPLQAMACVLIWGTTALSYTFVGLWVGHRATRSSRASGQALGVLALFLVGAPFLFLTALNGDGAGFLMGVTHPLVALGMAMDAPKRLTTAESLLSTGVPYALCQLAFGAAMWRVLCRSLERELSMQSGPGDATN